MPGWIDIGNAAVMALEMKTRWGDDPVLRSERSTRGCDLGVPHIRQQTGCFFMLGWLSVRADGLAELARLLIAGGGPGALRRLLA
ncbi:MAG: hypothetical protein R2762_03350 [Bryobacteraceae bacterium]